MCLSFEDICNEMMDLYEPSRRKSKSREGSVSNSPAYTASSSPAVASSPPTKKKVRHTRLCPQVVVSTSERLYIFAEILMKDFCSGLAKICY